MTVLQNEYNEYKEYELPTIIKHCQSCDHYYPEVKDKWGDFHQGHFCIHFPELKYDRMKEERLPNRNCIYYRDKSNLEHPYNYLRKNKLYYDLSHGVYI